MSLVALLPFLLSASSLTTDLDPDVATFRVRLDPASPSATVEARIPVVDGLLSMSIAGGVDDQPDGWATFLRGFEARGAGGEALELVKVERATWRVPDGVDVASLRYEVDLGFCTRSMPAGNEQYGKRFEDALFLVTRSLFVTSGWEGPARVSFELPEGWRVSTPWDPVPGEPPTFLAADEDDLVHNTLVAGEHAELRLEKDGFELLLCLPGRLGEAAPRVAAVLEPVVAHHRAVFSETPPTRFLVTFFASDKEDGEAFRRSAAFTTTGEVSEATRPLWGNFLAHELFHHWNGQRIHGEPRSARQWFSEGVTDFYANRALLRTGAIDERRWLELAARHLGRYLRFRTSSLTADVSCEEAGKRKGTWREGVYDGGWAVALCLDHLIRRESGGERSLDDLMRLLDARFGATGASYAPEDLVALASDVAGTDLSGFFAACVSGTEVLPLQEVLEASGLGYAAKPYAGDVYLWADEEAEGERARLRDALLGRP